MGITAALVKELRKQTGLGIMECKTALTKSNGNIEQAINDLRLIGAIKAANKANNVTLEGSIAIKISDDKKTAVMIEVNCQTDFLAMQDYFKNFINFSLEEAFNKKITEISDLKKITESMLLSIISKTGENICISRLVRIEGNIIGKYLHGRRIGVIVNLQGGNIELANSIAMHIAATNPQYLNAKCIPQEILEKEKKIFLNIHSSSIVHKKESIVEKMLSGRITKFLTDVSLVDQYFVKNTEIKIYDLLKKYNANIASFVRYELGTK